MFTSATHKFMHEYAYLLITDDNINGKNHGKQNTTVVEKTNWIQYMTQVCFTFKTPTCFMCPHNTSKALIIQFSSNT